MKKQQKDTIVKVENKATAKAVENKVKKTVEKPSKKTTVENSLKKKKTEEKQFDISDVLVVEKKTTAKKETATKKEPTKKETVKKEPTKKEPKEHKTLKNVVTVDDVDYQVNFDIKSIADLLELVDSETILFGAEWTAKQLKEFEYSGLVTAPKKFPDNIDMYSPVYISEEGIIVHAVSLYTESCYSFTNEDFEIKDNHRTSSDLDFQIYTPIK